MISSPVILALHRQERHDVRPGTSASLTLTVAQFAQGGVDCIVYAAYHTPAVRRRQPSARSPSPHELATMRLMPVGQYTYSSGHILRSASDFRLLLPAAMRAGFARCFRDFRKDGDGPPNCLPSYILPDRAGLPAQAQSQCSFGRSLLARLNYYEQLRDIDAGLIFADAI